jgi:2-polyprenyl-3-methyl-5-hydroxy-6-metoxy-1,4-benzoquinol methylase
VSGATSVEELAEALRAHAVGEQQYLRDNVGRFVETRRRLAATPGRLAAGTRILDVGAHWLHQALLYALDGCEVWALDVPATMETDSARSLSRAYPIHLLPNASLEHPQALAALADDTFDVVLLTEVIEHLAFNPVAMWREIHRVARRGATIVVTTPNYYALRARLRAAWRAMRGLGGGVAVDDVIGLKTFGHHWKEYSRRELMRYFALLSPDFHCRTIGTMEEYHPGLRARRGGRLVGWLERIVPPWRPDLYLEVEVAEKRAGIVASPHW